MANEEHTRHFIDGINFACDNHLDVDSDYEFDAACFYDFITSETSSEAGKAERWFDHADSYPPSPFVVKSILANLYASQHADLKITNLESKSKSTHKPAKSRSLSYMKPTASLLAKQDKLQEANCNHLCGRPSKTPAHSKEKSMGSPRYESLLPKRQKLERGYLRKVAQLRHQSLLLHKISNNVTVAKGPQLETMRRAERRSTKNISKLSENANPEVDAVKARSQNRNECGTSNEERLLQIPLIEEFSKLSIEPRSESNSVSQTRPSPCGKICPPRGVWKNLTNLAVTT